jgi:hypothetical protein
MFRFTCRPDGGESFEVVALSRAITAWENAPFGQPRGTKRSVGELTKNFKMADMVDLAWFAADKAGKTGLDLIQWRDQVDVELEKYGDDDDEAGPTDPTP